MSEKTLNLIKESEARWVDLRFTDTKGKEQHVSIPVSEVNDEFFVEGKMFDGSSIAGWKGINESDMILMPDDSTAVLDPFTDETTIIIRCGIVEPSTMQGYDRDPRSVARRAEEYLKSTGIGDEVYFGPEPEFFMFDDVKMTQRVSTLSGGEQNRLLLAKLFAQTHNFLVLDEPTAGVDIELRRTMWDFLEQINEQGTTIILTTHYLEEAERMCRNIAIIDEGNIILNSSMKHLLKQLNSETFVLYLRNELDQVPCLPSFDNVVKLDQQSIEVEVPDRLSINDLIHELESLGIIVERMRNKVNRLEEMFVKMTSKAEKRGLG